MNALLRTPTTDDWPAIHAIANDALPQAPDGNRAWIEARRGFDEAAHIRRHYVADDASGVIAYGGIESTGDRRYRLFLVMTASRLGSAVGKAIFVRLMRDLDALGAESVWVREHADDTVVIPYVRDRGFTETATYTTANPADGAYASVEITTLELPRPPRGFASLVSNNLP